MRTVTLLARAHVRSYQSWPSGMLSGMTEAQLAVLEPPYSERLMRRAPAPPVVLEGREGIPL